MTKKFVKYNGGKDTYYSCSNPQVLVKDKLYEVIKEEDLGFQTNYSLKGMPGKYNSVWFDEPTSYFAYSDTIPEKGLSMTGLLRFDGVRTVPIRNTSTVLSVEVISKDIYKVFTKNTLYIIKVLN